MKNKQIYHIMITLVIALPLMVSAMGDPWIPDDQVRVLKAFPGADGFGTDTPGGRGGKVIYVTNLNDAGKGSLRAALLARGPRNVLFSISGTINLTSDIIITNPYLTIAGQTAPGEGIQIRGAQIKITTHDVIMRYLKVRSGDEKSRSNPADRDAVTLNHDENVYNIVVDHCTLIWGPDVGGITFLNGARDSTLSYSIVGEGLYISRHPEANRSQSGHSMGLNITELKSPSHPNRITIHHNLITSAADRNPRVIGGEYIDIVNNVIYNWKYSPSQGNPRKLNLINNIYIKGPMSDLPDALLAWMPKAEAGGNLRSGAVYESGNLTEGFDTIRGEPQSVFTETQFQPYSVTFEEPPQDAYSRVVNEAGANLQVAGSDGAFIQRRDPIDQRIIQNLENREGTFVNGVNFDGKSGYPAISWPTLADGDPAVDTDLDGMPDDWENRFFGTTLRGSPQSSSGDFDGDGYTDLEEYLNGTDPTRP